MTRSTREFPTVLLLPAALAATFLALPLVGLGLRAPWGRWAGLVWSREVGASLWLSLQCSVAAAGASFVLGLPLALWLAEGRNVRARALVRALVALPMVLPPVVGGVALLLAFGRHGVVGAPLDQLFGVSLPFTPMGVVVAETYLAMPFFVLTVEGAARSLDRRFEDVAATLGAGPWRVFRTVTLPMLAPSLRVGLVLAWARALGEFGATITFAGNLGGTTRTMPLAVYVALERDPEAAIALSLVLVAMSTGVLLALRKHWFGGR